MLPNFETRLFSAVSMPFAVNEGSCQAEHPFSSDTAGGCARPRRSVEKKVQKTRRETVCLSKWSRNALISAANRWTDAREIISAKRTECTSTQPALLPLEPRRRPTHLYSYRYKVAFGPQHEQNTQTLLRSARALAPKKR